MRPGMVSTEIAFGGRSAWAISAFTRVCAVLWRHRDVDHARLARLVCPFAVAIGLATAPPAVVTAAAEEADFYRGKTITIIIPIGPGGAYDAYARLVARHLGRKLPGEPAIVPRKHAGRRRRHRLELPLQHRPAARHHARHHHL